MIKKITENEVNILKTIEEKLKSIEDSCLKLANQDNENLKQEINDKIQAEINEELILYKNKLEKKKKNAFEKMEKEYNSNLWKLELVRNVVLFLEQDRV